MILKVVGQVKGHREKMTMTLDTEAFRNSHKGFTSKQVKADFREFFEKKAEIENSISEINS